MDKGVIIRILLLIGAAALLFAPTVWAIRDAAHRRFPTTKAKAVWLAVVTLLPPIGAFAYIAVGRPRAIRGVVVEEDTGETTEDREQRTEE